MKRAEDAQRIKWAEDAQGVEWTSLAGIRAVKTKRMSTMRNQYGRHYNLQAQKK